MRVLYTKFKRYCFPSLEFYLRKLTRDMDSLVDLGCGPSSPIMYAPKLKKMIGVDGAKESVEESKKKEIFTDYVVANVLRTGLPNKCVDVAISLDVINLQEKQDALRLIEEMEHLAKKRIVLLIPNGVLEEPKEMEAQASVKYKSEYELLKYRSSWTAREMKNLGFNVIGLNGWKFLRKENAAPRIKPSPLGAILSDLTQLVVRFFPSKAFHLLCWKDVDPLNL